MFEALFSPLRIGAVTVRNRVMHLATRTLLHDGNQVSDRLIAYFEERVRGGVGSIVLSQPRPAARHAEPVAYGRDTIPGLRRLVHAMHRSGVPIFGQLNDSGRQHRTDAIPLLQGPSPVPCPFSGGTPHEMTVDEIQAVTAGMVVSSRHLQEAGIDGVEIHGAQGHLFQQFLSPASNYRTDAYGGSLVNRLRFHLETLGGIRQACGPGFVIGLRFGVEEFTPDGLAFAEARVAAATIAATGLIDYLSISQANFNSIARFTPDRRDPPHPYIEYPAGIRADRPGVPVVACGRILEPAQAEQILRDGQADLIGLCRPLLSDADWARKAFEGHAAEIRRCIGCNQCWSWTGAGRPIACVQNPVTGRELEWGGDTLRPVETPRRVVVVGGGPGGMEAARVAAMRGHRVTLFERETRLGGAVVDAAVVPSQADMGWLAEFLGDEMARTGVDVRLGVEAGVDEVRAERPDAVIAACGAAEIRDGLGDTGAVPVHTPVEILRHTAAAGDHVVVLDEDGYYEGCAIAEFLAQRGARVHLVTRFLEVGREIPTTSLTTTLGALDRLGVELVPTAWLARVEGRDVCLAHYYSGREWSLRDVDSLVHVGGRSARNALYLSLRGTLPDVRCIGDAYMPRRIADAMREGHAAGRTV